MPRGRRKTNIQDYDKEMQEINFKEEALAVKRLAEMGKPPAAGVGLDGRPLASDIIEDEASMGSLPAKKKGGRPVKVEEAKKDLWGKVLEKRAQQDAEAEMAKQEAAEKEALAVAREIREAKIKAAEPVTLSGTEEDFAQQLDSLFMMTEIAEAIGTTRKVTHNLINAAQIKPVRVYRGYGYYTAEQAKAIKQAYLCQYRRDKAEHVARLKSML